ncbi:hypothetical protein KKG71_07025 [Patescibacteria group bacterium]|nr:hypothetical protein [Patescibacteria group bacterium]
MADKIMSYFKNEDVQKINSDLLTLKERYLNLVTKIFRLSENLKEEKAKEYLFHGVARRLDVIERCVENIYSIFPLERETLLNREELKDVDINLHAFFINIFGLLDNLAWVLIHEKRLKINKKSVGLYIDKAQACFEKEFRDYLNLDRMKKWHNEYLKNYRDALSHRIPLYVPPKTLTSEQKNHTDFIDKQLNDSIKLRDYNAMNKLHNQDDEIGSPCPFFIHSISEEESRYVVLHAQVITDFKTVEEIIDNFCDSFIGRCDKT